MLWLLFPFRSFVAYSSPIRQIAQHKSSEWCAKSLNFHMLENMPPTFLSLRLERHVKIRICVSISICTYPLYEEGIHCSHCSVQARTRARSSYTGIPYTCLSVLRTRSFMKSCQAINTQRSAHRQRHTRRLRLPHAAQICHCGIWPCDDCRRRHHASLRAKPKQYPFWCPLFADTMLPAAQRKHATVTWPKSDVRSALHSCTGIPATSLADANGVKFNTQTQMRAHAYTLMYTHMHETIPCRVKASLANIDFSSRCARDWRKKMMGRHLWTRFVVCVSPQRVRKALCREHRFIFLFAIFLFRHHNGIENGVANCGSKNVRQTFFNWIACDCKRRIYLKSKCAHKRKIIVPWQSFCLCENRK